MSKLLKNSRGFFGLGVFVAALWAVIVVSYARQVRQDNDQVAALRPLQSTESCSSGESSGNSSGGER